MTFRLLIALSLFLPILASCGGGSSGDTEDAAPKTVIQGKIQFQSEVETDLLLSGVRVTATQLTSNDSLPGNAPQFVSFTDSTGGYRLEVAPGEYVVEADGGATRKALAKVSATAGASQKVDFALAVTGSIRGTLSELQNGPGLIYIPGTAYIAITDDEGFFEFVDIPVGKHVLVVPREVGEFEDDALRYEKYVVDVEPKINDLGVLSLEHAQPVVVFMNRNVAYWSSEDSVTIPTHLYTEFNVPMDKASVESNFQFVGYEGELEFTWVNDYEMAVSIPESLQMRDNEIAIAAAASSTSGISLESEFTRTFESVNQVRVHIYDWASEINIRFPFPQDIEQFTYTIEPPPLRAPVLHWSDSRLSVEIDAKLVSGQEYVFTILSAKAENEIEPTGLPYTEEFVVREGEEAYRLSPYYGTTGLSLNRTIELKFPVDISRAELIKNLTISDSDGLDITPDISFEFSRIRNDAAYVDLIFPKQYSKTYSIFIPELVDLNGKAVPTFETEFTTLTPGLMQSYDRERNIDPVDSILLRFNTSIDAENAILTITDADGANIPFTIENDYWSTDTRIKLKPTVSLRADSVVNVSWTNLSHSSGEHLLPDGSAVFYVLPRLIVDENFSGDTFTLFFNDLIPAHEQAAIISFVSVTKSTDGVSEVIEPFFTWSESGGRSALSLQITPEPNSHYVVSIDSGEDGIIRDDADNVILQSSEKFQFSTLP